MQNHLKSSPDTTALGEGRDDSELLNPHPVPKGYIHNKTSLGKEQRRRGLMNNSLLHYVPIALSNFHCRPPS